MQYTTHVHTIDSGVVTSDSYKVKWEGEKQKDMVSGCFPSIPLAAELYTLEKVTEKIETNPILKKMQFLYFTICQYAIIR
jgi:hypothetical protein